MNAKLPLAVLALVASGMALPLSNALEFNANERPLLALVTVESSLEAPWLEPRATVSPGWDCERPQWTWTPEFATYDLACWPSLPQVPEVVSWSCRNPAVQVDAQGHGSVTGTSECIGSSASCTAIVAGSGSCYDVVFNEKGIPPLRCRADVQGHITYWRVLCYNDP